MHVIGYSPNPNSINGSQNGTTVTLSLGTYNVTEDLAPSFEGYCTQVPQSTGVESGIISLGQTQKCVKLNTQGD
jgi:hypothetical protein